MYRFSFLTTWLLALLGFVSAGIAQPASIELHVDAALPDQRSAAPVRLGVPFAADALQATDVAAYHVVDDQGNALPTQKKITATWDKAGTQVRWLLVDFPANPGRRYFLKARSEADKEAAAAPIATMRDGQIHLAAGMINGPMPTDTFKPFDELMIQSMGKMVSDPAVAGNAAMAFNGFYIEHETRGLFRADLDKNVTITLEQTGPMRAIIRAQGDYTNAAGETFGKYSIRLHFFRNRPDVRVDHTFIYTGLSSEDRLRSVSVQLQRRPGARGYVGGEGLEPATVAHDFSQGWYVQDSHDHDHIELISDFGKGPVKVGGRSEGWMSYDHTHAVIAGGWRQYPWEFEVENGQMRVHFWPRHGRLMDTTFDGYFWFLTDEQKRFMLADKSKRPADLDAWEKQYRAAVNATGAAKTHTLWLSFHWEGGAHPDAWVRSHGQLAREVAKPMIAFADPAYATSTAALDQLPHAARDRQLFADDENYFDAMLTLIDQATEAGHWYGWWDYGGYYQRPSQTLFGGTLHTRAQTGGLDSWHRNRAKAHYGWGELPWQIYFRSGDRRWLDYGQTFTRYSADMAHVHHTAHGRVAGAEYHYDNSEIPWLGGWRGSPGGDAPASNLQLKADYVYAYWLTGEQQPLDVLNRWGQQIKTHDGTWNKWKVGFSRGNDIRNAGAQIHRLLMLYQATWDDDYLRMTTPIIEAFAPLDTAEKVRVALDNGNFPDAAGWVYDGLWLHWKITGDQRSHDVLKAFCDYARISDAGYDVAFGGLRGMMYGYLLTKDPSWLDMLRGGVDTHIIRGVTPLSWSPNVPKFTTITLPRILGAFQQADSEWKLRNLPLHTQGLTLGFRYANYKNSVAFPASRLFFNETSDRAWSFTLTNNNGGTFALHGPDGQVVLEKTFHGYAQFDVPADGKKGTYTLMCTDATASAGDQRAAGRDPWARLLRSDLPAVAQLPEENASLAVSARSLFFKVPDDAGKAAAVWIEPSDPTRPVYIVDPQQQVLADTSQRLIHADRFWRVSLESAKPGIYRLMLSTPDDAFFNNALGWPRDDSAAPNRVMLRHLPGFVSTDAEAWFSPVLPASMAALKK